MHQEKKKKKANQNISSEKKKKRTEATHYGSFSEDDKHSKGSNILILFQITPW